MNDYEIRYQDGQPTTLKFKPHWCGSNGTAWPVLGIRALREGKFKIPGWRYSMDYGGLVYTGNDSLFLIAIPNLVEEAQRQVTAMMDKLYEWDNIHQLYQELRS
jgi:hypothetical protein